MRFGLIWGILAGAAAVSLFGWLLIGATDPQAPTQPALVGQPGGAIATAPATTPQTRVAATGPAPHQPDGAGATDQEGASGGATYPPVTAGTPGMASEAPAASVPASGEAAGAGLAGVAPRQLAGDDASGAASLAPAAAAGATADTAPGTDGASADLGGTAAADAVGAAPDPSAVAGAAPVGAGPDVEAADPGARAADPSAELVGATAGPMRSDAPAAVPADRPDPLAAVVPDAPPPVGGLPKAAHAAVPAAGEAPALPAEPRAPSFDIVRVDASGQTVIAGRALPGQEVEVLLDGQVVDTVLADEAGRFVSIITAESTGEARQLQLRVLTPELSADAAEGLASSSAGAEPRVSALPTAPEPVPGDTSGAALQGGTGAPLAAEGTAGPQPLPPPSSPPDPASRGEVTGAVPERPTQPASATSVPQRPEAPSGTLPAGEGVARLAAPTSTDTSTGAPRTAPLAPTSATAVGAASEQSLAGSAVAAGAGAGTPAALAGGTEDTSATPGALGASASNAIRQPAVTAAAASAPAGSTPGAAAVEAGEPSAPASTYDTAASTDAGAGPIPAASAVAPTHAMALLPDGDAPTGATGAPSSSSTAAAAVAAQAKVAAPGGALPPSAPTAEPAPPAVPAQGAAALETTTPAPPQPDATAPALPGTAAPAEAGAASPPPAEPAPEPAPRYVFSEPVLILPSGESAPALVQPRETEVSLLQPGGRAAGAADAIVLDQITYAAGGELTMRGRARPGHAVRIYGDGRMIGTVPVIDGQWRTSLPRDRVEALSLFRLDEIGPAGQVTSRVEAPFRYSGDRPQELRARKVIVQRGDNLWTIAEQHYGEGLRFSVIYGANSDLIRDPDLIYPEQVFSVPELVEAD